MREGERKEGGQRLGTVFVLQYRTWWWVLAEMVFSASGSHTTMSASEPSAITPWIRREGFESHDYTKNSLDHDVMMYNVVMCTCVYVYLDHVTTV